MTVFDTPLEQQRTPADLERDKRFRSRAVLALAITVLLLAGAAVWWHSQRVQVGQGSFSNSGVDAEVANDGIEDTRVVVRGRAATMDVSVANDGRRAVTLLGVDPNYLPGYYRASGGFTASPSDPGGFPAGPRMRDSVLLEPGHEVVVRYTIAKDRCLGSDPNSRFEFSRIALLVRSLGRTTSQELDLPLPVTLTGRSVPAADC